MSKQFENCSQPNQRFFGGTKSKEANRETEPVPKFDSLAVYYHRPVLCVRVVVHHVAHAPPELEERVGEGVGVARPLRVVEQDHRPHFVVLEQEDGTKKCGTMWMEPCGTMGPRGRVDGGSINFNFPQTK